MGGTRDSRAGCVIAREVFDFVQTHKEKLDILEQNAPTPNQTYFGLQTLLKNKYLLRVNEKIVESPKYMYLRVACMIHKDSDFQKVIDLFHSLVNLEYTFGTPTLFNAGSPRAQCASCYLVGLKDDSIEGIYSTLANCARISKFAGGIGLHLHNLRGKNSIIQSTKCKSEGIIPVLRVFNQSVRLVRQSGKRPGSIAVYLSVDHIDIEDFIKIRRNTGDEDKRCAELFNALWISDLFMQKVTKDEDWYLFSPDVCPGLNDVFGQD